MPVTRFELVSRASIDFGDQRVYQFHHTGTLLIYVLTALEVGLATHLLATTRKRRSQNLKERITFHQPK